MKKLTLLLSAPDREQALRKLQELGVLHLALSTVQQDEKLEEARERLDKVKQLQEMVCSGGQQIDGQELRAAVDPDQLWSLAEKRKQIRQSLADLEKEIQRIQNFGSFDPDQVRNLREEDVFIRIYEVVPEAELRIPDSVLCSEIFRSKELVGLACFGLGDFQIEAREIELPRLSLDQLRRERKGRQDELQKLEQQIEAALQQCSALEDRLQEARDEYAFQQALSGLEAQGPVHCLTGFVPERSLPELREHGEQMGWGLFVQEVSSEDRPPTLLEHPAWVKPIKAVFELIGVVPGYFETDISLPFLLFLSVFFAMIVGDAGYGLLFLGGSLLAGRYTRLPREALQLLLITSSSTIIWGLLTGNVFGLPKLPGLFQAAQVHWLTGPGANSHLMLLCFGIGLVQLTLAHAWRLMLLLPQTRALAQLGWIMVTWSMFFLARRLVLLESFPEVMLSVLGAGVGLILIFMLPLRSVRENWPEYVRLPLDLISSFVDLVSYIRLFAVGMATLAIASAFNSMAAEIGFSGFLTGLAAAAVIFLGHGLNILLACMGVLVHGVRLNTLEFAGHTGIQWTGQPYEPFCRRRQGNL